MLMVRQSPGGQGLSRDDIHALVRRIVDVVIPSRWRAVLDISRRYDSSEIPEAVFPSRGIQCGNHEA